MAMLGGRAGALTKALVPLSAALLLAGCASMPSGGEVSKVDDSQQAEGDTQVMVYGIPPQPHETPEQIVRGFLEATTSGETDFTTARQYLAAGLKKRWDPFAGITVLSDVPRSSLVGVPDEHATDTSLSLDGAKVADVDAGYAYRPAQGDFHDSVHLVKQNGEWRIDRLDDGLVLSTADFQRIYHSVNRYYFANLAPGERSGAGGRTLIADPVYMRRQQTDVLSAMVTALLKGPSRWLAPVVTSAAPAGAKLSDTSSSVVLDDSQRLQVRLAEKTDGLRGQSCERLAAQIFATVNQASTQLSSVEVEHADGARMCQLGSVEAGQYAPGNLVGRADEQFYIGAEQHNLLEMQPDHVSAHPVAGPLGSDKADLRSVAVRRDGEVGAAVKSDGRQLVVGPLAQAGSVQVAPLTSAAKDPKNGLSAPSWDGFDDLWVADRNPAVSRLYVLPGGTGQPVAVDVPGLDSRIESLRVAADGVRIALVVSEDGKDRLELGRIRRGGTAERPEFQVQDLRDITPADESVVSVSWAGASRLVVLGTDPNGSGQQIQWVSTDGSVSPASDTIGEATTVAASEKPDQTTVQLLASSQGRVYWQSQDLNWKKVAPAGDNPVYPG